MPLQPAQSSKVPEPVTKGGAARGQARPEPEQNQILPRASNGRYYCAKLGFIAEGLMPLQRATLEDEQGLAPLAFVITGIDSSGAANGKLQPGDYLMQIAGVGITEAFLLRKAEFDALSVPKMIVRVLRAVFLGMDTHLLQADAHGIGQFLDCRHYVPNYFRAGKTRALNRQVRKILVI